MWDVHSLGGLAQQQHVSTSFIPNASADHTNVEEPNSERSRLTLISQLSLGEVGLVDGTAESDSSRVRITDGRGGSEGGQGGDDGEDGELHVCD